ncbi:hypothetical protein IWW38_005300, partial [Coemansia aciculifera]
MTANRRHSRAFPVVTWPLHRSEPGANYQGTDAFDLGSFGHMLPSVGPGQRPGESLMTIAWNPASQQPQPGTYNVVTEAGSPVALRPSTRMTQFLDPCKESDRAKS